MTEGDCGRWPMARGRSAVSMGIHVTLLSFPQSLAGIHTVPCHSRRSPIDERRGQAYVGIQMGFSRTDHGSKK